LVEIGKMILKFKWKYKAKTSKQVLKKMDTVGRFIFSDFKTYYKPLVIKTVRFLA